MSLFLISELSRASSTWRKGRDSNPRCPCGHSSFQDWCVQPLCHPSIQKILYQNRRKSEPYIKECFYNGCPYQYTIFMRHTQRKGDIATAHAIASFTKRGYDVLLPLTESAAYDLVIDTPEGLKRVQIKYAGTKEVDLRNIHSNSKGYVIKKVQPNAYDWLYIYSADDTEHLIKNCLSGRRAVTLNQNTRLI